MLNNKTQILLLIAVLITTLIFAQERENDTLKTNVIDVVKPYTPSISDAFKVKEQPSLDDDATTTKKKVIYNIFSFPVASTFTPAKGNAAEVDKAPNAKLFDNYASLGVGSYLNILGELYLNYSLGRDESVSAYAEHHSSQGGIKDVLTNNGFSDSKINLTYKKGGNDVSWSTSGGFQHETYNWYGLQPSLFNETTADTLDVGHSYFNGHIEGDIALEDGYFKTGHLKFRHFGDNYESAENRFEAKVIAHIPIQDYDIDATLFFDYLGGNFAKAYTFNSEINYGNFQIGISPTYQLKQDDLSLDLGITATYLNDTASGKSKFFIYPNLEGSYRVLDDIVIAFGGIKGGLLQNSYYNFTRENPFVSPTLFITPTDQQYNVFLGLKGKLTNALGYKVTGSYMAERAKPLFVNNTILATGEDYTFGNSFGIVYDNVSTFSASGELSADVKRNFTFGIRGKILGYATKTEKEAWNLPNLSASVFADYQITKQWFAGANLFYVGERKDQLYVPNLLTPDEPLIATLNDYIDVNLNLGYHINDRFSAYLKGNNLFEGSYFKWQNTRVQGTQVLAGATYKFDF